MTSLEITRDERIIAVENASYRWGYLFVSFALLISVMYRSFELRESSWDLLSIVVLGGFVTAAYQRYHRIHTQRWARLTLFVIALALALAAMIAVTIPR